MMTNAAIVVKNREQGKSESARGDTARMFFALWPDADVRTALYALARQQHQCCGGRGMRAETLHLTLLFLGDVPVDRLSALETAVAAIKVNRFHLVLNRFAGWRHSAIGYVGPTDMPVALQTLSEQLGECVARTGLGFDRKALKPHVTLLRKMTHIPQSLPVLLPEWTVSEFVLVKSVLDVRGPSYEIIGRWPLIASQKPASSAG